MPSEMGVLGDGRTRSSRSGVIPMAERSSRTVPALVMTSWSFPFTTTFADTTCDHPAGSPAENQSSPDLAASIRCGEVAPSITQTPTSTGPGAAMPSSQPRSTMTVIPSESDVGVGGVTRSPYPTRIPCASRSSPTLALIVRTASGRPWSTTSVTVFWIATYVRPPTSRTLASSAFPIALRARNRRTRVGRTGILPPIGRRLRGEAAEAGPKPFNDVRRDRIKPSTLTANFNLGGSEGLLKPREGRSGVLGGDVPHGFHRFAPRECDRFDHVDDVRRRVVATAEPLGREERAVGLDEDPVERHGCGRLAQMLILRIRDVPGEGEEPTALRAPRRDLGIAAEAMEDDAFGGT